MRYRLPNGQIIDASQSFTLGEGEAAIQYPPFYLRYASPEELQRLGVEVIPDAPDPSAP